MVIDRLIDKIVAMQNPTCVGWIRSSGICPRRCAGRRRATGGRRHPRLQQKHRGQRLRHRPRRQGAGGVLRAVRRGGHGAFLAPSPTQRKGLFVIADCKRNDIGSTAARYSAAYLGRPSSKGLPCPWRAAISSPSTLSGNGRRAPFLEDCKNLTGGSSSSSRRATPPRASCRT